MFEDFIRASQISTYTKSPFLLWADAFADKSQQDELNAFQEMLFERGDEHEKSIIDTYYPDAQEVVFKDALEGFEQTKELLMQGVDSITQAPLFWLEERLRGRPDVLEKREGPSIFGNHHYVVKEIKYAKNLKEHHVLQAAFYNKLLGHIQGYAPKEFILINNEAEEFVYVFEEYKELLETTLSNVRKILSGDVTPLPAYNEDWPWTTFANTLATENQDITLLFKLGSSMRKRLQEVHVHTLQDFLDADQEVLLSVKGIGKGTYLRLIRQAQSLLEDAPVVIKQPTLPTSSKELYFDIEGDTELGIDYLYGILDEGNFIAFWAENPEDEQDMWNDFCAYIGALPDDAVLYHYAPYEKQSIKKLRRKYGCEKQLYDKMLSMLVDLFSVLTKSVTLPLTSYSIKPVAKYLDFSWRADDAGGANSMEWYRRYLDGSEEMKQKILDYNHDDVIATQKVKEFLETLKK
jgi:uncharacterized protein